MTSAFGHRRVLGLAIPVILANLTQPILSAVDTAIAGHFSEGAVLGGVALGGLVFNILFWSCGFLRMTTTGLIAQASGAGDAMGAWLVLRRSLLLAAILGCLMLLLKQPLLAAALDLLGGSPAVSHAAHLYGAARMWSAPATLANYVVLGVLLGQQRATAALVLQAAINLINMAAALLFVYGWHWGVGGLGAATALADWAGALLGLGLLWRPAPSAMPWHQIADFGAMTALIGVNRDMFVRTLCLLAAFTWFSHAGAAEGDTVLAANAILLNFQTFMAFGLDGFANAAEALVGHALGSRDRRGFDQAVRVSTLWALVTALGFALAYALAGPIIVAGLTSNAAIRTTALHYLPWAVVSPLISVWGFQLDGIFIGATRAGDLRRCMMVALAGFLPAAIILQSVYGNAGLWAALMGFMALRGIGLAVLLPRIGRGIVEA